MLQRNSSPRNVYLNISMNDSNSELSKIILHFEVCLPYKTISVFDVQVCDGM